MSQQPTSRVKLGTFVGVFTPTVLTILGVIMFLRMGWVDANAGIRGALLIVIIANTITLITALSMSVFLPLSLILLPIHQIHFASPICMMLISLVIQAA